jgi:hypothetical protein
VKYTIVAFGVMSLVGMPSQNLFVAMAMWTLCGWLLLAIDHREGPEASARWSLYAAAALLSAAVAGLTFEVGALARAHGPAPVRAGSVGSLARCSDGRPPERFPRVRRDVSPIAGTCTVSARR